ncbi:hypothetical protein [Bacillus toyonensis]|uniref:Uncharacterized protein n=1 Tax=Bacillus toyonensis TaxID=155322 RepID=A0A2B5X3X1_9BACI|nr:hypothetical protein [Bacillus toyonensis]PGA90438.1 hypothetical protein COL93_28325 [Bacillus toyonensis]PHD56879.1 hypothetical protein COF40_29445 [Bacillus toyonensis]
MLKKILLCLFVGGILFSTVGIFKNQSVSAAGINSSVTVNNTTYKWSETSWGSNRGITINPGQHVYQLSPNPHNDPWYNKNQVKFYDQIINQVANQGNINHWTTNTWATAIHDIKVDGITYTLNIR